MKFHSSKAIPFFALLVLFLLTGNCSKEKVDAAVISVPGLKCNNCELNIKNALKDVEGIISGIVDIEKKTAEVKYFSNVISLDDIRQKIANAGYDADNVKTTPEAIAKLPSCCKPE